MIRQLASRPATFQPPHRTEILHSGPLQIELLFRRLCSQQAGPPESACCSSAFRTLATVPLGLSIFLLLCKCRCQSQPQRPTSDCFLRIRSPTLMPWLPISAWMKLEAQCSLAPGSLPVPPFPIKTFFHLFFNVFTYSSGISHSVFSSHSFLPPTSPVIALMSSHWEIPPHI